MLSQQLVPAIQTGSSQEWSHSRMEAWVAGFSSILGMQPQGWNSHGEKKEGAKRRTVSGPVWSGADHYREIEELREAKDRAEHADRMKSRLVASASHEIRNMLGAVIAYSELLKIADQDPEERTEVLDGISRSSAELMTLVNDLLEMAKIEEGQVEIVKRTFAIKPLIRDIEHFARVEAKKKGIDFEVSFARELPCSVNSDPCRIKQVLLNVVGNAIKFTEAGRVHLAVGWSWRAGGTLRFTVRDTGAGISKKQMRYLFKPFSQLSSSHHLRRQGVGLGMKISRDIARVLGGDLKVVESQPGAGTTFEFVVHQAMACDQSHQITHEPTEEALNSLAGVKILLADDSVEIRHLVSRILKCSGATVECAENGIEAIEKAAADDFNVVLMDVEMPVLDGCKAVSLLRYQGFDVPVIALTGHSSESEKARCMEAGFSLYVSKPICRNDLMRAISKLVHT